MRPTAASLALLCSLALLLVVPAGAQAPKPLDAAAETITEQDVIRHIRVIADDSMLGRDTPSRGLDLTAQYVADRLKSFGLTPGGENGTWFQRYPITRRHIDAEHSMLSLASGREAARAPFTSAARYVQGTVPDAPVAGNVLLVGGTIAPDHAAAAAAGRVVLFLMDRTRPASDQVLRAIYFGGAKAVILLSDADSASFGGRLVAQTRDRTALDLGTALPVIVEVREAVMAAPLAVAGVKPAAVRAATRPVLKDLLSLAAIVDVKETVTSRQTAPNTIGILPGTDPKLRNEYVIFSAHMDHIGVTPGQPDSINNGADDDASGTTAVMELAQAFSRPDARPRRSLIFMTVSGEEKGLWGSRYFSEHPVVPLKDVVADINIDMIGRNWPDTIVAIGKEHSDLGATLNRVNAQHPELGMTAIDDRWPEERFYFRSDHYNFARKGVPILFFFNGVHEDYHRPSDSPDKIEPEKEARIIRLIFYLGEEVASAAERPKWKPESYKEIVEQ
jgi:Zn-dependent M28 family amino/carboxypeptidase